MRNNDDDNQRGVTVSGRFEGLYEAGVSGTTNGQGRVFFETPELSEGTLRFIVTDLSHPDFVYAAGDNRADTTITVKVEDD